ncbi:MAG: HAD-IA family hydrolase [Alphaproteobacteria bacterium]
MPATRPLRLAVFDCDGTLVDSQHMIVAAMTAAWRACGMGDPLPDRVRRVVGLPLVEACGALLPDADRAQHQRVADCYVEAFRALRLDPSIEEPLFPGVRTALETLDRMGVMLGIATGKGRRGLLSTLERHGLARYFVVLKTADDGPGKPSPHILLAAMDEAGATPETTTMIGDTTYDIQMALAAATRAVGVSWGYHPPAELAAVGAHRVIDDFSQLNDALDTVWGRGWEH